VVNKYEKVAAKVLAKWLKKGNMARAMRDILPNSKLDVKEREKVAKIVHDIVRFKKLYEFAMIEEHLTTTPENYIKLSKNKELIKKYHLRAKALELWDIHFSSSVEVSKILLKFPKFGELINTEPKTHLAININKISRAEAFESLRQEGFKARACTPETCIETVSQAKYSQVVKNNTAIVQDSSSQHVAKIISALGDDFVDYCAGSGGKSFTLKFFKPDAKVYVHDINDKKIAALFARAEKLDVQVEVLGKDGEHEVVLVDAPCSGLGSAARNPEAKYQENLQRFPEMQAQILNEAKTLVAPGGFLVYVVCTFNPEETYLLVEKFLTENSDFEEIELAGGDFVRKKRRGFFITSGDVIYTAMLRKNK